MCPQDNKATKATKSKTRIRPDGRGEFMAYNYFGYYCSYGRSMERAVANFNKLLCELT